MKFTQVLYKIHIGKAIRYVWQHQQERPVLVTGAEKLLTSMGFKVEDALNVVKPPKPQTRIVFETDEDLNLLNDKCYNVVNKSCLLHENHNVLQEGVSQACLLTNTLQVDNKLPQKVEELVSDIPKNVNEIVKRIVYSSTIYDPQQIKLPRIKDPERPAWVFPRVYGICSTRKMYNLTKKFLQLCESLSGLDIAQSRSVVFDGLFCLGIDKASDFIQFSSKMDLMMTSFLPLSPIANVKAYKELEMPNIHPLHPCIGLGKSNVSKSDKYPMSMASMMNTVHTIFINYDPEEVKNLSELPVTDNQIYARSMLKSFTAAAVYARQKYGENVERPPEPVVVQCIQSDGQKFHFSVYQLNTLNLDDEEVRNFWWSEPFHQLYETAGYEEGIPSVQGYNNEVFKKFFAFYRNT